MDEANDQIQENIETDIQGYDIDEEVIRAARQNAQEAGVSHLIHLQQRAVKNLSHPKKYGFIVTNPPYGERLRTESHSQGSTESSEKDLRDLTVGRHI